MAVVDTGVEAAHPALQGRLLPGYDSIAPDASADDDNGHGTAVAGIVARECPVCRILPVKVLAANGTGSWGNVAAGIAWAADNGAEVIALSLGASHAPDYLGGAIAHALAAGAIVVAAAGDAGTSEQFFPAAYPGVVSVAGVDGVGARYSWSNFGAWVTVAAPGCTATPWLGGGYKPDFCGTSAAVPFVAAAAGLARAVAPSLSPAAFASALAASSAPLVDGAVAAAGRIDTARLVASVAPKQAAPVAGKRGVRTKKTAPRR